MEGENENIENFIRKIEEHAKMEDCVVDSWNQLIDEFEHIIENFQFCFRYQNEPGEGKPKEQLEIRYQMSNMKIETNKNQLTRTHLFQQRELDFDCEFIFDTQFLIYTCGPTGLADPTKQPAKTRISKFTLTLNMMTGCKLDPVNKMSSRLKFDAGLDENPTAGLFNIRGSQYVLPYLLNYVCNKPIVVVSTKTHQLIRTELLRRDKPIHDNSYYTIGLLAEQKKTKIKDLVVCFKNQHDGRFLKETIKNPLCVPVSLVAYAFGIKNDEEFIKYCNMDNDQALELFVTRCLRKGHYHEIMHKRRELSVKDARQMIAKIILQEKYWGQIDQVLDKYISPHGRNYLVSLGEMVNKMYKVYRDPSKADNKDDLTNKRFKSVAEQVVSEYRSKMYVLYNKHIGTAVNQFKNLTFAEIVENPNIVAEQLEQASLDLAKSLNNSVKREFTSANSSQQSSQIRKVINEDKSYILVQAQIKEAVIRAPGQGKVTWPERKVDPSQYGFIDPLQTPEAGENVGRYLNSCVYVYVSLAYDDRKVTDYIVHHPLYIKNFEEGMMYVNVNHIPIGFVTADNFKQLYDDLMFWRIRNGFNEKTISNLRNGIPNTKRFSDTIDQLYISIYYNILGNELCVDTDAGRELNIVMEGYWNGTDDRWQMFWKGQLIAMCQHSIHCNVPKDWSLRRFVNPIDLRGQILERPYKDTDGITRLYKYYDFSYRRVGPSWFLPYGLCAGFPANNPYISNMKAVRASLYTSQAKECITAPYSNSMARCTNYELVLQLPQYSPANTSFSRATWERYPMAQLAFVCFIQLPEVQEDATTVNTGYIARNGMAYSMLKTYFQTNGKSKDQFQIYPPGVNDPKNRLVNNPHFMADKIGLSVNYMDTLIWEVTKEKDRQHDNNKLVFDLNYERHHCEVSNVINDSLNDNVTKLIRIEMARSPILGDKLITNNAQKMVIGHKYPEWMMPCTRNGIVPSFIMSSVTILKRETYGEPMEPEENLLLAERQQYMANVGVDEPIANTDELVDVGQWEMWGNNFGKKAKYLTDRKYKFEQKILAGPMTMHPQYHLSSNKIRSVDIGKIDKRNMQPESGKNGALRNGTLEQNALGAHAICETIVDEFGWNSSNMVWYECKKCDGINVFYDRADMVYKCPKCGILEHWEMEFGGLSYSPEEISQTLFSMGCEIKVGNNIERFK